MTSLPSTGARALVLALGITVSAGIGTAHAGTLNASAQAMFDDLGAVGNLTAPQAFQGQALSTYTGGSLFIRTPTKNYNLAAIALPYVKAGCGGIDVFGGSFSHISSDEFKNMLKNVTSALPGVAFQMMLKSVEPLFGSTIEWFKDLESFVNRANINSCEAATSLVSSIAGKAGLETSSACQKIAGTLGMDAEAARTKCTKSSDVNSVLSSGAASAATRDIVPFTGNLVWSVVKRWAHLDDKDRELIMSLTGTTIYPRATDGASEPRVYPPTIRNTADLLYGNVASGGSLPAGHVRVKLLTCGGSDCNSVVESVETMPSIVTRVRDTMRSLSDKIATRSGAPTEVEVNFVNAVPAPVYRLLSSSNAINNPAIAESKIGQYTEYVAVEFAYALLSRAARMGMDTAQLNAKLNDQQAQQMAMHRQNAQELLRSLENDRKIADQRTQTFVTIAQDIQQLERSLRANMPQQVADLLGYSASAPMGR